MGWIKRLFCVHVETDISTFWEIPETCETIFEGTCKRCGKTLQWTERQEDDEW